MNMKPTSEKVLPPRASRCDCPSCPSRGRVLSAQSSTIAPLALVDVGHAAREDVNDRFSASVVRDNRIIETMGSSSSRSFLQLGREKLVKVSDTFQCLPSPAVTHSMPTRSPCGHLRNPHVRATSMWAGLSYTDAPEISG